VLSDPFKNLDLRFREGFELVPDKDVVMVVVVVLGRLGRRLVRIYVRGCQGLLLDLRILGRYQLVSFGDLGLCLGSRLLLSFGGHLGLF
jgi:hypothetical protein